MKLFKCPSCEDLVAMRSWRKKCKCGRSSGHYLPDGRTVAVSKDALVLGVPTEELFRIPDGSPYVKWEG